MLFLDRDKAGQKLAVALRDVKSANMLVLGIPRGGVIVARPIAEELAVPLDIIVPRKIGMPGNPEFAVGAVAPDGTTVYNAGVLRAARLNQGDLEPIVQQEVDEIRRREKFYRGDLPPLKVSGKRVVLVDDGAATGYTLFAALDYSQKMDAGEIIAAVPVAPPDTAMELAKRADILVCLHSPEGFMSVGQFYWKFDQVSDQEVINILQSGNNNTD